MLCENKSCPIFDKNCKHIKLCKDYKKFYENKNKNKENTKDISEALGIKE